jgi:Cu+-exporting ATPase
MKSLQTRTKAPSGKQIDPVCGMSVVPGDKNLESTYDGRIYLFCAEACRRAFEADPRKYLESKPVKQKGWFGRLMERMAKANEEHFGCAGPKCH